MLLISFKQKITAWNNSMPAGNSCVIGKRMPNTSIKAGPKMIMFHF